MNENLTALYDEVRSFFNGEFLKFEMACGLLFCSKSVKSSGFLSIYTEKKVSYILKSLSSL
ncbi:hypothetical protein, partial [Haemophilus parainfluenzae]